MAMDYDLRYYASWVFLLELKLLLFLFHLYVHFIVWILCTIDAARGSTCIAC